MRSAVTSLSSVSWPEVPPHSRLVVPIGSTEQHGPHLPFTTDAVIAEAVARGVATGDRVLAPVLAFGSSGEHQSFAGTLSIGTAALASVIVELVRSASTWATAVTLVNGHGGNLAALESAVLQLRLEGHDVAWLPCAVRDGDAHAGRTETSVMLALAPEEVDMARAAAGATDAVSRLLPALEAHGVASVSPTGVLGDPTGANAEEGARLLEAMIASARRRVRENRVDARGCLIDPGAS